MRTQHHTSNHSSSTAHTLSTPTHNADTCVTAQNAATARLEVSQRKGTAGCPSTPQQYQAHNRHATRFKPLIHVSTHHTTRAHTCLRHTHTARAERERERTRVAWIGFVFCVFHFTCARGCTQNERAHARTQRSAVCVYRLRQIWTGPDIYAILLNMHL